MTCTDVIFGTRNAANYLTSHGIREPVTWSPPLALVDHLALPGRGMPLPDTEHAAKLIRNHLSPSAAASALGTSPEHLRHSFEPRNPTLERPWPRHRPDRCQETEEPVPRDADVNHRPRPEPGRGRTRPRQNALRPKCYARPGRATARSSAPEYSSPSTRWSQPERRSPSPDSPAQPRSRCPWYTPKDSASPSRRRSRTRARARRARPPQPSRWRPTWSWPRPNSEPCARSSPGARPAYKSPRPSVIGCVKR